MYLSLVKRGMEVKVRTGRSGVESRVSHWRAESGESIRRVIVKEQESEASDRQGLPSHSQSMPSLCKCSSREGCAGS